MITGTGLGLRFKYLDNLLNHGTPIKWVELLADNFHDLGNPIINKVDKVLENLPCVLHSVNLSLASSDPLNKEYVSSLKKIVQRFNPVWVSDHLCFSHVNGYFFHDLLPIAFTKNNLNRIASKIIYLQDELKRPFLIENISSYLRFNGSEMSEPEFIRELTNLTGCGILLDVNNIVVTCHNHNESVEMYCKSIPFDKVKQIHMAGATDQDTLLIDTHGMPISENVFMLYKSIINSHGVFPTCLEWDSNLPEFEVIANEVNKIDQIITRRP